MDANKIIEHLLDRIKGLTKEVAFLHVRVTDAEEQVKHLVQQQVQNIAQQPAEEVEQNVD